MGFLPGRSVGPLLPNIGFSLAPRSAACLGVGVACCLLFLHIVRSVIGVQSVVVWCCIGVVCVILAACTVDATQSICCQVHGTGGVGGSTVYLQYI